MPPPEEFPLHNAVCDGNISLVASLLKMRTDLDAIYQCATPLHHACEGGHADIVRILLEAGASRDKCEPFNGHTPLLVAIIYRHTAVVAALLAAGADPNTPDKLGTTPLHYTAYKGYTLATRELLAAGADQRRRDSEGNLALHLAIQRGSVGVVETLATVAGTEILHAVNNRGMSPLYCAVANGIVPIVSALLKTGAKVEAPGDGGISLLAFAVNERNAPLVKLLIDAGANAAATAFDNGRLTALHLAAAWCDTATASLLLDAGADEWAQDGAGRAVIDVVGAFISDRTTPDIATFCRLLARAPAFRARSWLWPVSAPSPAYLARLQPSRAAFKRVRIRARCYKKQHGKRWTPITAMCR